MAAAGVAVASLAATGGGAYDPNAAYAGGGMVSGPYAAATSGGPDTDPSDRAYDGGGLVTAATPTGDMTGQGAPPMAVAQAAAQPAYVQPAAYAAVPAVAPPAPVSYQSAAYDVPRSSGSVLGSRYASRQCHHRPDPGPLCAACRRGCRGTGPGAAVRQRRRRHMGHPGRRFS